MSTEPAPNSIFRQLTFMKRKPGTTQAEFEKHWSTTHADLACALPIFQDKVYRYEQLYPQGPDEYIELPGGEKYDGVVVMDFRSLQDRDALNNDKGWHDVVLGDSKHFIDVTASKRVIVKRAIRQII